MRGRSRLIFTGGSCDQVAGAFGDLGGLVADAFEVLGNLHRHGDETQIGGQRRLGEQLDGQVVDLHLKLVDDAVVVLDAQGEVVVALDERLQRLVHRGLGVARHRQQFLLQHVQLHVEMFHSLI